VIRQLELPNKLTTPRIDMRTLFHDLGITTTEAAAA